MPGETEPSEMEKRFAFLAVVGGLAEPTDMVACLDEVRAHRDSLSPNVPVVMVRRGLLSETEARALLHLLATYEVTPVDQEFGNIARDTGHISQAEIEVWKDGNAGTWPPAPWPLLAAVMGHMQLPAIHSILETQQAHHRGLLTEIGNALRHPPPSRREAAWKTRLRRVAGAIRVFLRAFTWLGHPRVRRVATWVLLLAMLGAVGAVGTSRWRASLRRIPDTGVRLLICQKCQNSSVWLADASPVCPHCFGKQFQAAWRCNSCLRVQAIHPGTKEDKLRVEPCRRCGKRGWMIPYLFVQERPEERIPGSPPDHPTPSP
jgi:hypothetical protein